MEAEIRVRLIQLVGYDISIQVDLGDGWGN